MICLPNQFAYSPCGIGIGLCEEGFACLPETVFLDSFLCLPLAGVGGPCGTGVGGCAQGGQCSYKDTTYSELICIANGGQNETCDEAGHGGCIEGFSCVTSSGPA